MLHGMIKKLYLSRTNDYMLKTNVKCKSLIVPLTKIVLFFLVFSFFLETVSEEESPVPSYSHLNSESSIPEDLGSPAVLYMPSESVVQGQPGTPSHSILTEEMVFSQELESSTSPSKHVSSCVFIS
jgi:hypothetical protein